MHFKKAFLTSSAFNFNRRTTVSEMVIICVNLEAVQEYVANPCASASLRRMRITRVRFWG